MNPTPLCLLIASLLASASLAAAQEQTKVAQIPASAETAQQRLKDSPRHGEWVDVPLAGSDIKIKTWVVYPERKDPAGVVIVIHEIFGLTDWVRAVADQLAADGFIAVAPDLLSGMGPGGGGTESLGEKVREQIRNLTPDDQHKRLDAVRDYALALPSTNGKSATIGFCWGGSASFAYATRQPALNAAVVYYGSAPKDPAELARIQCPVIGFYGGNDNRVNATLDQTTADMTKAGKTFIKHIYEGAGHGFLRQQSGQNGANLKASQQAWEQTLAFLNQHLK
ncbi:dienelactone hydrolase family protein [Fontivita pretiosa]|uniref:dienelactone hydrolase family protein n=1 Tax=Fontivita pretiosa TaxID=2989684 RepID=UPI003D176D48